LCLMWPGSALAATAYSVVASPPATANWTDTSGAL